MTAPPLMFHPIHLSVLMPFQLILVEYSSYTAIKVVENEGLRLIIILAVGLVLLLFLVSLLHLVFGDPPGMRDNCSSIKLTALQLILAYNKTPCMFSASLELKCLIINLCEFKFYSIKSQFVKIKRISGIRFDFAFQFH